MWLGKVEISFNLADQLDLIKVSLILAKMILTTKIAAERGGFAINPTFYAKQTGLMQDRKMKIYKRSYLVRSKHEIQRRHSQFQEYFHEKTPILRREKQNRSIPSFKASQSGDLRKNRA